MRYILMGKLNRESINKSERVTKSKEKLAELGANLEWIYYTQGPWDFVDLISTDDPQAALAFSAWYATQGYGSITTLPAFTSEEFSQALEKT